MSVIGCSAREAAEVDTIEVHHSGWVGYNIIIHADGTGEFEGSPSLPEKGKRTFVLKPGQFEQLSSAIRPYMRYAKPATEESVRDVIEGNWPKCSPNAPYTIDAGALYLHWQGPKTNVHYLVDFGCNEEKNRARNRALMDAVHSLPIRPFLGPFA
jgi:hypothetical protein